MMRFFAVAVAGVLALVASNSTASAQKHGGPSRGHLAGSHAYGRGHGIPRGLYGRSLPRNYARFNRYRYDPRYRSRFYLAGNAWYYYYAPFQCYLPVEVIETYRPTPVPVTTVAPTFPPTATVPPETTVPPVPPVTDVPPQPNPPAPGPMGDPEA
jgi:hypothetical protein